MKRKLEMEDEQRNTLGKWRSALEQILDKGACRFSGLFSLPRFHFESLYARKNPPHGFKATRSEYFNLWKWTCVSKWCRHLLNALHKSWNVFECVSAMLHHRRAPPSHERLPRKFIFLSCRLWHSTLAWVANARNIHPTLASKAPFYLLIHDEINNYSKAGTF